MGWNQMSPGGSTQAETSGIETVTIGEISCQDRANSLCRARGTAYAVQVGGTGRATWSFDITVDIDDEEVRTLIQEEALVKHNNLNALGYTIAFDLEGEDSKILVRATGVLGQTIKWGAFFEYPSLFAAVDI